MTKQQNPKLLEEEIQSALKDLNLSPLEMRNVVSNLRNMNPHRYAKKKVNFGDKHVKFGVISDAHMGHMGYRPDITDTACAYFKREGVDFIVNAGDTIEGMSGRDGHIYEITHIGATAQMDYAEKEFQKFNDWHVYSIEADSSHGGWFKSKGNMGLDIGPELERRIDSYEFLGYDEQDLDIGNGITLRLRHPGGGTAYALSYKMQKYIESIGGGDKPNIAVQGHFHKAGYIFYRNVHCFDAGTLSDQSPFMKKKGSPAHTGFWIVDAWSDKEKKGIERIVSQFVPFYD